MFKSACKAFQKFRRIMFASAAFSLTNYYLIQQNFLIYNQQQQAQQSSSGSTEVDISTQPTSIVDIYNSFIINDIFIKKISTFEDIKNLLLNHRHQSNTIVFFAQCPQKIKEKIIQLLSTTSNKSQIGSGYTYKSKYKFLTFDQQEYLSLQESSSSNSTTQNNNDDAKSESSSSPQQQPSQVQEQQTQQQNATSTTSSTTTTTTSTTVTSNPESLSSSFFFLQKEQKKDRALFEQIKNADILIVNKAGDLKVLNFQESASNFYRTMAFLDPPQELKEPQAEWLLDKVSSLPKGERIVLTYIPEKHQYENQVQVMGIKDMDLYRQRKLKNVKQLEEDFRKLRYDHLSNTTRFFVIRDEALATSLNISRDDIGEVYHLKRGGYMECNSDVNWIFRGKKYIYSKVDTDPNADDPVELNLEMKQQKLYDRDLDYVNEVDSDAELHNLLRMAEDMKISRLLVAQSSHPEKEYQQRVLKKLMMTKRSFRERDYLIIFTRNRFLLQKYFNIIPEEQGDTFRLIDFSQNFQDSIFSNIESNSSSLSKDANFGDFHIAEIKEDKIQSESEAQPVLNNTAFDLDHQQLNDTFYARNVGSAVRYRFSQQKITTNKLITFIRGCLQSSGSATSQQQFYLERDRQPIAFYSEVLNGRQFKQVALDQEENCLVYFYKPSCAACNLVSQGYELMSDNVLKVQELVRQYETGQAKYIPYEDNAINRFRIINSRAFVGLKVYRYNIYNECPEFPSPSATPLIFLFKKGDKMRPIQFDLLKDKVKISDPQYVTRYLLRKLEEELNK